MAIAQGSKGVIETLGRILEQLVPIFGPSGTIIIIVIIVAGAFLWRYYNDRRKDREVNALIAEKERTIQRLAKQERELRIFFLKHMAGWTDEQVERFVMLAEFEDAPSARRALEERRRQEQEQAPKNQNIQPPNEC